MAMAIAQAIADHNLASYDVLHELTSAIKRGMALHHGLIYTFYKDIKNERRWDGLIASDRRYHLNGR
ncbi:hypothetical protein PsorP6_015771 [Peronosclerospora sorghi]|uniref:Uncharacterized protein n=1 Tax=Peronosclerospora sorghi TaxID=230839 RepID=A0ACC0WNP1_9STRA|nr:hypothetical protein PsorP6_015771 [Peronosclerospora sorghi]